MTKEEKLTSVKITQPLFDNFKMACLQDILLIRTFEKSCTR
mgnify:CR=1 FL=1